MTIFMKKEDLIESILQNIMNNLLNPYNKDYLEETFYILNKHGKNFFNVDLFEGSIEPVLLLNKNLLDVVDYSKKCLINDLRSNGLEKDIKKVSIVFSSSDDKHYLIKIIAKTQNNNYLKEIISKVFINNIKTKK
jgi:hypothetical protein